MNETIQRIITDPHNDIIRLAYADELEDNGEHGHAKFIRYSLDNDRCLTKECKHNHYEWKGEYGENMRWLESPEGVAVYGEPRFGAGLMIRKLDGCIVNISRGLPYQILCTFEEWYVSACKSCVSYNAEMVEIFGPGHTIKPRKQCKYCRGTGKIPGFAFAACEKWPLTDMCLTGYGGIKTSQNGLFDFLNITKGLPSEILRVTKHVPVTFIDSKIASLALSSLLIDYGRILAGFDPIGQAAYANEPPSADPNSAPSASQAIADPPG